MVAGSRRLTPASAAIEGDQREEFIASLICHVPIFPILPREIFGRFVNESFWMDPKNNVSQVPIV